MSTYVAQGNTGAKETAIGEVASGKLFLFSSSRKFMSHE